MITWSNGGRRSVPWTVDEYLYVDGLPCTYTIGGNQIIVHLPGGSGVPLPTIRATRTVVDPIKWRTENYT